MVFRVGAEYWLKGDIDSRAIRALVGEIDCSVHSFKLLSLCVLKHLAIVAFVDIDSRCLKLTNSQEGLLLATMITLPVIADLFGWKACFWGKDWFD